MTTINQLATADALTLGDLMVIFSTSNGDARKASLNTLLQLIQDNLPTSAEKVTQYAAPSATGFTVQVTDGDDSIWLVMTPAGNFALGTVMLPPLASAVDKQEVLVNCSRAVTVLNVLSTGATVVGAPTSLAANDFFLLRFDAVTGTWYRVG